MQYTTWPDHGVPETPDAFLQLLESVDRYNSSRVPIIVHCSAGIGRSGVFCAVHSILHKIEHDAQVLNVEPSLNLVDTVIYLRNQRPGMIQNEEQYTFCYYAIQLGSQRYHIYSPGFGKRSRRIQDEDDL